MSAKRVRQDKREVVRECLTETTHAILDSSPLTPTAVRRALPSARKHVVPNLDTGVGAVVGRRGLGMIVGCRDGGPVGAGFELMPCSETARVVPPL